VLTWVLRARLRKKRTEKTSPFTVKSIFISDLVSIFFSVIIITVYMKMIQNWLKWTHSAESMSVKAKIPYYYYPPFSSSDHCIFLLFWFMEKNSFFSVWQEKVLCLEQLDFQIKANEGVTLIRPLTTIDFQMISHFTLTIYPLFFQFCIQSHHLKNLKYYMPPVFE